MRMRMRMRNIEMKISLFDPIEMDLIRHMDKESEAEESDLSFERFLESHDFVEILQMAYPKVRRMPRAGLLEKGVWIAPEHTGNATGPIYWREWEEKCQEILNAAWHGRTGEAGVKLREAADTAFESQGS
jgi:hypothetical protein